MGNEHKYINGGCGLTREVVETIEGNRVLMEHMSGQNDTIILLVGQKMDNLVNQLIAKNERDKDQVPLSVFKWIIIFLLVFTFSLIFGVNAAKELFGHSLPTHLGAPANPQ